MPSTSEPNAPAAPRADTIPPSSALARVLLGGIAVYQRVARPLMPPTCRFFPSCSDYAVEAITVHGVAEGTKLAVARICRCHPFHPGGVDLVPPRSALPAPVAAAPAAPARSVGEPSTPSPSEASPR